MTYDYGLWGLVALHVISLVIFALAFLRPARRREWRSLGVLTGFVVALYVEMYGFPLTIYVLTTLLGHLPVPQYSGLFLIIVGALVQWPTIPTAVMAPALVIAYIRLAWREERELEAQFGEASRNYRRRVPGFVPAVPVALPGDGSAAPKRESS